MAKNMDIELNKKVIFLDMDNKYIEFNDGIKVYYEKLISSISLPKMVKIIKDIIAHVKELAENLVATLMRVVSVGSNRSDIARYLWFYI